MPASAPLPLPPAQIGLYLDPLGVVIGLLFLGLLFFLWLLTLIGLGLVLRAQWRSRLGPVGFTYGIGVASWLVGWLAFFRYFTAYAYLPPLFIWFFYGLLIVTGLLALGAVRINSRYAGKKLPSFFFFLFLTLLAVGVVAWESFRKQSTVDWVRAVKDGDRSQVSSLLQSGRDPNARDPYGKTLLMSAAWNGDLPTAELLLQAGAQVNALSPDKDTALSLAVLRGSPEIVRLLLSHGADVHLGREKEPLSVLARRRGNPEVLLLIESAEKQ